jgi:hypothetical protein
MSSLANIVILGDYERALRRFSNWETLDQRTKMVVCSAVCSLELGSDVLRR